MANPAAGTASKPPVEMSCLQLQHNPPHTHHNDQETTQQCNAILATTATPHVTVQHSTVGRRGRPAGLDSSQVQARPPPPPPPGRTQVPKGQVKQPTPPVPGLQKHWSGLWAPFGVVKPPLGVPHGLQGARPPGA
jgi:hypothetical protein